MPAAPRMDNKFKKIAYSILGKPEWDQKPTKWAQNQTYGDQNSLNDLQSSKLATARNVLPTNYF